MNNNSIIKFISNPHAWELHQARYDESVVTGQPMVERPFWFENTETDQLYFDIYGCIGYPSEVSDRDEGLPGYAAIVGIVRPDDSLEHTDPVNANFQLLAEAQSKDVGTLLSLCVKLRKKYGFGCQENLLRVWYGDPERFLTTLALYNEGLVRDGGDKNAILVTPPIDFYSPKIFDNYVRALRSTILPDATRFYFGHNDILRNRLREFRQADPAVLAVGGLVQSLLTNALWMDTAKSNAFTVEEK